MSADDYYDYEDRIQEYWDWRYKQIDAEDDQKRLARQTASDRYFLRHRSEGVTPSRPITKRPPTNKATIVQTVQTVYQQIHEQLANMTDLPAHWLQSWLTKLPQPDLDDKQARKILSQLVDEVRAYRDKYPFHLGYTRLGAAEVLSSQLLTLEIQLLRLDDCFFEYHLPED